MSENNHVVCTSCGTINRLAERHDAHSAKCGKCGVVLFNGEPVDVTAAQFDRQVAKSDIPVLVDVWAPWCGPCQVMGPQFAAAAKQAEPAMRFIKLNSDAVPALSSRLSIRSIPTMLMFQNGMEVGRVSGAMSSSDILKWAASVRR